MAEILAWLQALLVAVGIGGPAREGVWVQGYGEGEQVHDGGARGRALAPAPVPAHRAPIPLCASPAKGWFRLRGIDRPR